MHFLSDGSNFCINLYRQCNFCIATTHSTEGSAFQFKIQRKNLKNSIQTDRLPLQWIVNMAARYVHTLTFVSSEHYSRVQFVPHAFSLAGSVRHEPNSCASWCDDVTTWTAGCAWSLEIWFLKAFHPQESHFGYHHKCKLMLISVYNPLI